MLQLLRWHDGGCSLLIVLAMRFAVWLDDWRRAVNEDAPKLLRRLRGSLRKVWRRYVKHRAAETGAEPQVHRRRAFNRLSPHVEEKILRLHVGWPSLGAAKLRDVLYRVHAIALSRETVRRVIRRSQKQIAQLERAKRRRGRFEVALPRKLWGIDLTLVWVLGFVPMWIAAIVDYRGSYVVALEPLRWPTSAQVAKVLERACERYGAPARVLSDRGPEFRAKAFTGALARLGVAHTLTRPTTPGPTAGSSGSSAP